MTHDRRSTNHRPTRRGTPPVARFPRPAVPTVLAMLLLVVSGCSYWEVNEEYPSQIEVTFFHDSATIIAATELAIKDMRLKVVSSQATAVDGRYVVRSALEKMADITLVAIAPDRTRCRIVVSAGDPLGRLMLDTIRSKIREAERARSAPRQR